MGVFAPLTNLITLVLGVSMAVERVIEMLKGFIPPLATQRPTLKAESFRCALLHGLAFGTGSLIAAAGHVDLFQKLTGVPTPTPHRLIAGYLACGLLSAGGSAFWNNALDLLKASKIRSESTARAGANSAGNQNPIPA